MSKTIEQLRAEASQIEEATRQGENTQLRVGGLFQDIIDFIGQIPITETVLGPLLTALNNSNLIDPGDGQTLTFSIMKDGWTFSDALTQLKISQGRITQTITSNYEEFLRVKDQLEREVANTDQRVRSYKTDFDNSQIEYHTWRDDTDTHLAQYAAATDRNTGQIISISGRVDTAFDQLDFVTNNLEAADKALEKLFNLNGLDYDDPDQSYTASWLYKNRQGIYGAAATFDENGNILQDSKLEVTVNGIRTTAENADGRVSILSQTVDEISARVSTVDGKYSDLKIDVNGISATVNDPSTGIGALNVKADRAELKVTTLEGKVADLGVRTVKKDENNYITEAYMNADLINFKFSERWSVRNANDTEVMWLEPNGNLHITGILYQANIDGGTITDNILVGTGNARIEIYANKELGHSYASGIRGFIDSADSIFDLGFQQVNNNIIPSLDFGSSYYRGSGFSIASTYRFTVGFLNNQIYIRGPRELWPTSATLVGMGGVYVDNGTLKVNMGSN